MSQQFSPVSHRGTFRGHQTALRTGRLSALHQGRVGSLAEGSEKE